MLSRRQAIGLLAGTAPVLKLARGAGESPEITPGPFKSTRESLKDWQIPSWYCDAKFGMWAHWGPQSAAEYGDWYARNMYIQGHRQYEYHVKTYGHPSKFGFKDVIPTWKADKFDPDYLMRSIRRPGRNTSVAWVSTMTASICGTPLTSPAGTRWRPGRRSTSWGCSRKPLRAKGLRFAVSEHLAPSYNWFSTSHGTDKMGPLAGLPYDGVYPAYADLYHEYPKDYNVAANNTGFGGANIPDSWRLHYFKRIKDLVDNYKPDLLYTDGGIYYEEYGLAVVANHYNTSAKVHEGHVEAVYTSKAPRDCETGTCILDLECGVARGIPANPWQTDACIGDWHYNKEARYKSPKRIIDMLADIVSRNGNLMPNFPLPNSGALDAETLKILDEITRWMAVNSDGIYATRPWKSFGDGPVAIAPPPPAGGRGDTFNERNRKDLTADEVRFTTKGTSLYAFVMGWPGNQASITALAVGGANSVPRIRNVELLGHKGKLRWTQDAGV
jgi:alpha-L-fucosidase